MGQDTKIVKDDAVIRFEEEELRRLDLFRSVCLDAMKGLTDACSLRTLQPDEILLKPGEVNWTLYGILAGRIRIHLESLQNDPVTVLGPGETVGEMSVIDHQPTSAFAVADTACRILVMDEDILWSLVQSSHAASCNLLYILCRRLRHADRVLAVDTRTDQDVRFRGSVDALTGLHNRSWFEHVLQRQILRSRMSGGRLSLVMIDIDHFRAFNRQYGHAYGDRILYSVAHSLSNYLRPTEIVARYGGDEFIVLLPNVGFTDAASVAARLHEAVMNAVPATPDGENVPHPGITAGVTEMQPGQTMEGLLAAAEEALAGAKSPNGDNDGEG